MDPNNLSFGLAFIAGVASFVSPCVLSLVPAYVSYLGSRTVTADGQVLENRRETFLHGLAFVLGFSVVFIGLGLTASVIGQFLYDWRTVLAQVGGLVVIVFGLHTLGILHIPFLEYDTRRQQPPDKRLGYAASALMGVFFSAGWAPCVGPILGAVLTLAFTTEGIAQGAWLLTGYSIGLGIPFLLAAAGLSNVGGFLKTHRQNLRYVTLANGVLLIFIGVLLLTNSLSFFATLAPVAEFQIQLEETVIQWWTGLTGGPTP